ncbi:IS3 family transposase [Lacrimispora sp. BS-2]|uniref:IS3 family transposase n=1 Tax=Lacrimispora sp. BS-2 TaxID=3151850 RepID=UPI0032EB6117
MIKANAHKCLAGLQCQLTDYVNWFNHHRIHSSLGYLTPAEYRMNTLKNVVYKSVDNPNNIK